jgi:hypothetical protein
VPAEVYPRRRAALPGFALAPVADVTGSEAVEYAVSIVDYFGDRLLNSGNPALAV